VTRWGDSTLKADVGAAIRRHRELLGLSQADLAEAIGRSIQALGEIERGRSAPSFETLEAISRVLGTPVRDFFPGHPEVREDDGPAGAGRVLALLLPLSPQERAWVERVLVALLRDRPGKGG